MSEHYFIGVSSCYAIVAENKEITTDIYYLSFLSID